VLINELFDNENGVFLRSIQYEGGDISKKKIDRTVDSSVYGIFDFDVLPADDPRVVRTMKNVEEILWVEGKGGVARYENDNYHRMTDKATGNPWLICTLWLAKWYIAKARKIDDLKRALELINWESHSLLLH
jgi:GH15 family glucan-1,4-alpha-glucosidase